ncbi:hypothetical protein FRC04_012198 [Tulasnella sp. 424]|nr:hypothetical protein FRC04_012198 [Tulasnella sp. 424]
MSIIVETPLAASELSTRWKVDEKNIFTIPLLDTLIPAISQQIADSSKALTSLNHLTNNLLPLSRQAQAVLLHRGVRARCTLLWKYLEEWTIPSLEDFLLQAIRLLEKIEVRKASTAPASLLDAAKLAGIRCSQAMHHIVLLDHVVQDYKDTAHYFFANPIPPVRRQTRKSYLGYVMTAVFQQAPVRSSSEEYHAIINLVEQSQDHCGALGSIFRNASSFCWSLVEYFKSDGLAAASSNLHAWYLRERWIFLLEELVRAKEILKESRVRVAKLNPPLQYHAYPLTRQMFAGSPGSNLIPWTLDDLLGSKHSKQFKTILDDLTWNTERLGRYYKAFAEAVSRHPNINFRMDVYSPSSIVTCMRDWFDPTIEANAANILEAFHSASLRDTDVCGTTLEHIKAFHEMWADITAWLANFQPERPRHVPWPWGADASAQASAMDVYTQAQWIVKLMNDHQRTLLELQTYWGKFRAFRDIATKDAVSKPSEKSKDLHYKWGRLRHRMSSLSKKLGVISLEISSCGPLLLGPFRDFPDHD